MRLIDVEALGHPAQGDRPPAGSAEAATPETTTAFALHAIAKLLNSLLHILFVASAEVLCPSRCAADAHRLRRPLGPRAIEGQARKIAVARAPARPTRSAEAGISTGKRRKCAIHHQTLKSPARRRNCRVVIVRLILLPRSQNQFGVRFRRWVLRIQHHFQRESCESHEFHAYYISPAGHARQPEFAFGVGRRSVPLPRQSIGRGYRHSRQWRLAASRRTIDFIGWQSRGSRHGLRRREGRHLLRRQGRRKRNRRE